MSIRNKGTFRRPLGQPIADEAQHTRFITPPTSDITDLRLPLMAVDRDASERARKHNKLVFYTVGDTGGIHGTFAQEAIANAMEQQLTTAAEADRPGFFYHLGDVVYFNGLPNHYDEQFYEPYQHYQNVIFAIPGNHDGDTRTQKDDEKEPFPSLQGFMDNFCQSHSSFAAHHRDTMTQPYVWWTLETPVANIIGLYSNVAGSLDGRGSFEQQNWFHSELKRLPKDKPLLVAVHHPPYSLDTAHGGSPPHIVTAIDDAIEQTGRIPDLILSGHVHSYQRFTRKIKGRDLPYIVAGAGGFAHIPKAIHKLQKPDTDHKIKVPFKTLVEHLTLASYQDTLPGFLRISIDADKQTMVGEYFTVGFEAEDGAHELFETFTLDLAKHKLVK